MTANERLLYPMTLDLSDIRSGETKRGVCPKCHRYNTFTLSKVGNTTMWNCYSASCGYKGVKHNSDMSVEDIRHKMKQEEDRVNEHRSIDSSKLVFADGIRHFLKQYEVEDAPVLYDPIDKRMVFLIQDRGETVDAIGRSVNNKMPKWKRYGNSVMPVVVPFDTPPILNLVIVEDIISAWKVCTHVPDTHAMALLGTSLPTENLNKIWKDYSIITIALDKDATDKAIKMSRRIAIGVDKCRVVMLEVDLKDMTVEEINKCLN